MAQLKQFSLETKYQALRIVIKVLYGFGVIAIIMGLYAATLLSGAMPIVAIILGLASALLFALYAQLLQLFIDMEWNQRETIGLLEQVISNQKE